MHPTHDACQVSTIVYRYGEAQIVGQSVTFLDTDVFDIGIRITDDRGDCRQQKRVELNHCQLAGVPEVSDHQTAPERS